MFNQAVVLDYEEGKKWSDYYADAREFVRKQIEPRLIGSNRKLVVFAAHLRYTDHLMVYIVEVSYDIIQEATRLFQ